MNRTKQIVNIAVFAVVILVLTGFLWLSEDKDYSDVERRKLTQFEDVKNSFSSSNTDTEVKFEEVFEKYLLDQFPLRDDFRKIKSFLFVDMFGRNENNGYYKYDGIVVKTEQNLSLADVEHAIDVSNKVIEKYFPNNKVYFSIIPDKHYFVTKQEYRPAMNYDKLFSIMKENMNGEYIDITDKMNIGDFYMTDSHWSQDKIDDVAQFVLDFMNNGTTIKGENGWNVQTKEPFKGVYFEQSALAMLEPDTIKYLTNEVTDGMTMTILDAKLNLVTYQSPYIEEMFDNKDSYDLFMGGAQSVIVVDNPNAENDKELVIFRDSFGSSITPLLACGYKKVYVLDLRYINPGIILNLEQMSRGRVPADFLQFNENQDVLFMYSTGLLNEAKGAMQKF